jgi:hypothetical protein
MMAQKLGLAQALHVSDFPALKEADQRKSLDMFISTCKDMAKAGDLTVEKAKVFTSIQAAFSKAISNTNHQHRNYLRTALKENGLLRMTASLEKLYDKALEQFERDPEMMDRVRQAYLQDQRYMTNFVRILLVPLSTALNYDFNGGGESTRDGQVKFTDLTEATGNGLTALALANTHLCKSSWKDVLKEFVEIITLDQFYDIQYHSCMNNFEPVVWEAISEFERKYGEMNGTMIGRLILMCSFFNSRATHVTKVRQILERDPLYDANNGDFTNQLEKMTQFDVVEKTKAYEIHMQGSHTLFEKPSLTRTEAEIKKKEQDGKNQKSGGARKSDGGALTFTAIQMPEVLEAVCAHFGVDTHPVCDKCHMRHNPAGGCVKAELAMKAFELSGPIVKAVAQAELTLKQNVTKDKKKSSGLVTSRCWRI